MTTDAKLVLVTCETQTEARDLAYSCVEKSLAACAQVLPGLDSVYRWHGEIKVQPETLLLLKTSAAAIAPLKQFIQDKHSYSVPEFLVFDATDGLSAYLQWITDNVE